MLSERQVQRAMGFYGRRHQYNDPDHVKDLQRAVGSTADGIIGPNTIQAVARFQEEHALAVDGMAGDDTWAVIAVTVDPPTPSHVCPCVPAVTPPAPEDVDLSRKELTDAVQFNRETLTAFQARLVQNFLGVAVDGVPGKGTSTAVAQWQAQAGITPVDGKVDRHTLEKMKADPEWSEPAPEVRELDYEGMQLIMEFTKLFEGGRGSDAKVYGGINPNMEYEGRWDQPRVDADGNKIPYAERQNYPNFRPHWASKYSKDGGRMIGLSWGAWQGTQDGGTLGKFLALMWAKDEDLFYEVFRGRELALEMLKMTLKPREPVEGARSPRVHPVGGEDLWEGAWFDAFKEAARHEVFRQAQRDVVASSYLVPALEFALPAGFRDQGSLSILFDIAVQFGAGGMRKYAGRGLSDMATSGECGPEDIERVIDALPGRHPRRRRNILRVSNPFLTFTTESIQEVVANPPYTRARHRELRAKIRAL